MSKEIEEHIEELRQAMYENIEASKVEVEARQRKTRARYRLLKAKEVLRAIEFDNYQIQNPNLK